MGTVYWITGLSGAGKTTIGSLFFEKMKAEYPNTVFFDGDMLRNAFGNDLGYSEEERRKCAMRYSRLCKLLQEQDINVICCTISMFDEIRDWNRHNINNYMEIYVKVPMKILHERNQKGLYSAAKNGIDNDVAGIQVEAELPKNPDLVLENDGSITPEKQVEIIFSKGVLQ